jgi:hypothetical protein
MLLLHYSFSITAGTAVQVLVLRAKHYSAVHANTLDAVRDTHEMRAVWRQRRKVEAHKGRCV